MTNSLQELPIIKSRWQNFLRCSEQAGTPWQKLCLPCSAVLAHAASFDDKLPPRAANKNQGDKTSSDAQSQSKQADRHERSSRLALALAADHWWRGTESLRGQGAAEHWGRGTESPWGRGAAEHWGRGAESANGWRNSNTGGDSPGEGQSRPGGGCPGC